ncbi:glycosyltransferase family 1 protein [Kitasatospora nipponensis]|uniref:Glycosyltransferase family 1 protein n=1 Tax=Kitasatospora nipponensis TaxID=258049 RepID=A0ABP4GYI7_9ACTN
MTATPLRIVRIANFVTPVSGGLRTALRHLGAGYLAAGHEPVLVIPGPHRRDELTDQGRVVTLPGRVLPASGGYRVLTDRRAVERELTALAPDRLEVSDRTTLRWTGRWAGANGVRSAMVSHENATGLLRTRGLPEPLARSLADRLNSRTAAAYDQIICTTAWAAAEFRRLGVRHLVEAPLGVDLEQLQPWRHDATVRARYAEPAQPLLVLCSRLSPEKRPGLALDALAELRRRGQDAVLVVAGTGPLRERLEARARRDRLPVRFLGHLAERAELAALLASADATVAPGPIETFGLAALEALACGTPVAVSRSSALSAIVGPAGAVAEDSGTGFADAVEDLLARPEAERRAAARAPAERYGRAAAVAGVRCVHEQPYPGPAGVAVPPAGAVPTVHASLAGGAVPSDDGVERTGSPR